jgi:hypothetical protein
VKLGGNVAQLIAAIILINPNDPPDLYIPLAVFAFLLPLLGDGMEFWNA